mmetsp:Transcript_39078/g.112822  ORF Transcript_39078/g.112822 Transcript_39078/m.112822 type:complete len:201 (-) Transcript_39078:43-645(-)
MLPARVAGLRFRSSTPRFRISTWSSWQSREIQERSHSWSRDSTRRSRRSSASTPCPAGPGHRRPRATALAGAAAAQGWCCQTSRSTSKCLVCQNLRRQRRSRRPIGSWHSRITLTSTTTPNRPSRPSKRSTVPTRRSKKFSTYRPQGPPAGTREAVWALEERRRSQLLNWELHGWIVQRCIAVGVSIVTLHTTFRPSWEL